MERGYSSTNMIKSPGRQPRNEQSFSMVSASYFLTLLVAHFESVDLAIPVSWNISAYEILLFSLRSFSLSKKANRLITSGIELIPFFSFYRL